MRHRNFRLWLGGISVSNIGTWMQRVAQDWLVLTVLTHHSPVAIGATTACQFAPVLFLSLAAGSLADRYSKRRIVICTQMAMGVESLALGLLVATGSARLWNILVLALVLGITSAVDGPARQSFAGEMVPPADLTSAVSLNAGSFQSGRLVGPALAGLLINWLGLAPVVFLNAASFAAVLVSLVRMRPAELFPPPPVTGHVSIRAAVREVAHRPNVLIPLWLVFIVASFGLNFQVTNGLMATTVFHRGAGEYGVLGSVLAVGSLTGALLAAHRTRPRLRLIVACCCAFGVLAVVAAGAPSYLAYAALLAPLGLLGTTMLTSTNSNLQLNTPPGQRGRVMALYFITNHGGNAVGAPVIGGIAALAGPRVSLSCCGLVAVGGSAAAALLLLRSTHSRFRLHRRGHRWPRLGIDVVRRRRPLSADGDLDRPDPRIASSHLPAGDRVDRRDPRTRDDELPGVDRPAALVQGVREPGDQEVGVGLLTWADSVDAPPVDGHLDLKL
jgi:MFS family permease